MFQEFNAIDCNINICINIANNSRRPPRPPRPTAPNGYLFPENAQGYVEFDLFEDSDEIPESSETTPEESEDHVLVPRLPPAPPPKPPRPNKKSVPGNDLIIHSLSIAYFKYTFSYKPFSRRD